MLLFRQVWVQSDTGNDIDCDWIYPTKVVLLAEHLSYQSYIVVWTFILPQLCLNFCPTKAVSSCLNMYPITAVFCCLNIYPITAVIFCLRFLVFLVTLPTKVVSCRLKHVTLPTTVVSCYLNCKISYHSCVCCLNMQRIVAQVRFVFSQHPTADAVLWSHSVSER